VTDLQACLVEASEADLKSDISGMDIDDHQGTTGGSLQAGQLTTHQAHNLVQLCRALLPILGQALVTLCGDGLTHLFGPVHLQTTVKTVGLQHYVSGSEVLLCLPTLQDGESTGHHQVLVHFHWVALMCVT